MTSWEHIVRSAKECHTKEAWSQLFHQFGHNIASTSTSKPISELYRYLRADQQSLQYPPVIWQSLLRGSLSSWNLELGREIAAFSRTIPSAKIAIPAAEVQMESGSPSQARKIASRALRLTNVKTWESLQLRMIVCKSYVEEGRHTFALRQLNSIQNAILTADLKIQNRAELSQNMGRANFFLGLYPEAAQLFYQSSVLFRELRNWEGAAKGLFNAAASYSNSGNLYQDKAFTLVAQCKRLSEERNLPGPLSHCHAFFGTDAFLHGNFASACEHYRNALAKLPASDKSFRRLHILSMLTFTYLRAGRYPLASKFGQKTLDLASLDDSKRFRSRYSKLEAELAWQKGRIEDSQELLEKANRPLFTQGVRTLEELSSLGRYYLQSAKLNIKSIPTTVRIAEQLKSNAIAWLDYCINLAQITMTQGRYQESLKTSQECFKNAKELNARYHKALSLLTIIQAYLAWDKLNRIQPLLQELEIYVDVMGENPLLSHIQMIRAGLAFREGKFQACKKYLQSARKLKRVSYTSSIIIQSWLSTIEGYSPKLTHKWQTDLVARATRIYFNPKLKAKGNNLFDVNDRYQIDLSRHPILGRLIWVLLNSKNYSASPEKLQSLVWRESLSLQGWQQKIRNTITRVRDFCPFTIAPLILHTDNQVRLFSEAIHLHQKPAQTHNHEDTIIVLLQKESLSSIQLSSRLNVSQATTKRALKRLQVADKIKSGKIGRQVFYHLQDKNDH